MSEYLSMQMVLYQEQFDDDIEDDDENMPSSSHDDTLSDSEEVSTEYEGSSSGVDYVERSFQVLFIDDADIPEVV